MRREFVTQCWNQLEAPFPTRYRCAVFTVLTSFYQRGDLRGWGRLFRVLSTHCLEMLMFYHPTRDRFARLDMRMGALDKKKALVLKAIWKQ